ncbi:MAG: SCP2 sterol-binding domain-containing protein [Halioglobus sp.]|nr:SCP2 sterol-binding domain-containing protein [Halioglobus sp.]
MPSLPDPTLHTAALAALEVATNRALTLSPGGPQILAPFDDHVFAFHCTAPTLDCYLLPSHEGLRLTGVYDGQITTSLTGTASDFIDLAQAEDTAATLVNGGLSMEGNSAPLIELQRVLSALEVDWEAPLVDTLGDVAGHQIAQLLRQAFSWSQLAASSLVRQLGEFVHEEARLSPPRLEIEDFYRDIHELGLRVDRLESRTQRLRQRLQKLRS